MDNYVSDNTFFYNMHAQWTLPHHFNLLLNMNQVFNLPFFTPHETINTNPLFFPWQPQQTQAPQTPQMPMQMDNPQPVPPQEPEEMWVHRASFTEISSLRGAALMLFLEMEDKKYIHHCPVVLYKCSLHIRPPLNTAIAKYAVVLIPSLRGSQFPQLQSQNTITPQTNTQLMNRPTSFGILGEPIMIILGITLGNLLIVITWSHS